MVHEFMSPPENPRLYGALFKESYPDRRRKERQQRELKDLQKIAELKDLMILIETIHPVKRRGEILTIDSKSRKSEIVIVRQIFIQIALARGYKQFLISRSMNRDHSGITHHKYKAMDHMAVEPEFNNMYHKILNLVIKNEKNLRSHCKPTAQPEPALSFVFVTGKDNASAYQFQHGV